MSYDDNLGPPGEKEGPGPLHKAEPHQTTQHTTGHRQDSQQDNPNAVGGPGGGGEATRSPLLPPGPNVDPNDVPPMTDAARRAGLSDSEIRIVEGGGAYAAR